MTEASVKSGVAPETLVSKRMEQVSRLLGSRPVEAVSMAKSLFDEYPDDDGSLALYLKAAIGASLSGEKGMISEELCDLAEKTSKNRFFNPELISLSVASKMLTGKNLNESDLEALQRACVLDRRITRETVEPVCGATAGEACDAVRKIIERPA